MNDTELLLGKATPLVTDYAPQLLFPIERAAARIALGLDPYSPPFRGEDVWHAYELSWLLPDGKPDARVGRFSVPADSPNLIESKSFKLYLNSLNFATFSDEQAASQVIERDLSAVAGAPVRLTLFAVDDVNLSGASLPGRCIDDAVLERQPAAQPAAETLQILAGAGGLYHSHLLRSLCPVTSQPDWASVLIRIEGAELAPGALLEYLLAYRQHQEFHEQCVERIFRDIDQAATPQELSVQAFYTRRGGLDINPWRSSGPGSAPLLRLNRQ